MSIAYTRGFRLLAEGALNWATADVRLMLVDDSYTPDKAHTTVSQVVSAELDGDGYERKETTRTVFQNDAEDWVELRADAVTWAAIDAGVAAAGVWYLHAGADDAANILIAYVDEGGFPVTTNGGAFTYTPDPTGVQQLAQVQ